MQCGLALCPETKVDKIKDYLVDIDEVLVLLVTPGAGGQKMQEDVLEKIEELANLRKIAGYHYEIIVDGGVNDETIGKVQGADIAVVGSYICKSEDFQAQIDKVRL